MEKARAVVDAKTEAARQRISEATEGLQEELNGATQALQKELNPDSHELAHNNPAIQGAVTQHKAATGTDGRVTDIGWHRDPAMIPDPLIDGIPNGEVFTYIRRFNKVRNRGCSYRCFLTGCAVCFRRSISSYGGGKRPRPQRSMGSRLCDGEDCSSAPAALSYRGSRPCQSDPADIPTQILARDKQNCCVLCCK